MPATLDIERLVRDAGLRLTHPWVAAPTPMYEHPHAETDSIIGAVGRGHAIADVHRARAWPSLTASDEYGCAIGTAEVVFWGCAPAARPHPARDQPLNSEGS